MKWTPATLLIGLAWLAAGCTPQSQQEYQAAGQNLKGAAQATGKAVATDAQVAAQATKNAAEAAKTTVQTSQRGGVAPAAAPPNPTVTQTTVDAHGNVVKRTVTK